MSPFVAKTEVFEGPLQALLNLIEERKLSVSEVSLAKVADDFIAYAKRFEAFPIAESASFILVAATLLLIKSKSLLPALQLTEEEKSDMGELERRLAAYQKTRAYAASLRARFGKNILFWLEARQHQVVFAPDAGCTPDALLAVLRALISTLPRVDVFPKVVIEKVVSLEEMIIRLTSRIQSAFQLGFRDFAGGAGKAKKEIIVSFLAMLELVRRGELRVNQEKHFDDIVMETDQVSVPRYH